MAMQAEASTSNAAAAVVAVDDNQEGITGPTPIMRLIVSLFRR